MGGIITVGTFRCHVPSWQENVNEPILPIIFRHWSKGESRGTLISLRFSKGANIMNGDSSGNRQSELL
jgi:hypothetical protein